MTLDSDTIERVREALAHAPGIAAVWIFGSLARGEERPDSDVDFGVLLSERGAERRITPRWLGELASRLETAVRRPVDIVLLEAQGPMLGVLVGAD